MTTSAERIIGVLASLVAQHDAPAYLRSDTGAWKALTDKEGRFNGKVRDNCITMHQLHSLAEASVHLTTFRQQYNHERPHTQLEYLTRLEFKIAW